MPEIITRPVSLEEALTEISLFPIASDSFMLPGFILKILSDKLEVTQIKRSTDTQPPVTLQTQSAFEYSANGKTYFLQVVNAQLLIEVTETLITSS